MTTRRRLAWVLCVILVSVGVTYQMWKPWAPWADRTPVSLWEVEVSSSATSDNFDLWGICWSKNAAEGFIERNVPGDRRASIFERRVPRVLMPSDLRKDSDGCTFASHSP